MATADDNDIWGGRRVVFHGSRVDGQERPRRDNRSRVNNSECFYVVQLCGTFVNVTESQQRVLKKRNRQTYVTFEKLDYQLRPPIQFRKVLERYTRYGAPVHLLGMDVTAENLQDVRPWPFIWIEPRAARQIFQAYYIENDMEKVTRLRREFPI